MKPLVFKYGKYENLDGYWAEVIESDTLNVIAGGHFNTHKECYAFYIRSRRYFGSRLATKMRVII